MMAEGVIQLTDPRALRAVAHPTRLRLMGLLRRFGPLTATQAGARMDESPAGCSYHLRALAKWGLVEEAGGGRGRERPWQATSTTTEWAVRGSDDEADEAGDMLSRVVLERWFEEAADWIGRRRGEPHEWAEAPFGDRILYLTAAELVEVERRIGELLDPYMRRAAEPETRPPGARAVSFVQLVLPLADDPPPP
jgi:DNA-binding transcriptional ArsR family regulator